MGTCVHANHDAEPLNCLELHQHEQDERYWKVMSNDPCCGERCHDVLRGIKWIVESDRAMASIVVDLYYQC